jgi:hypothetical protein
MFTRKRILHYVLLAAVTITGMQCSDDDDKVESDDTEPTCYPTVIPVVEDVVLTVTYTADHKVATATSTEDGDSFRSEYVYTDGKVSRINYFDGNEALNHVTFTYATDKITESYYSGDEVSNYYIYYLTDGRVTSWSYRTPNRETRLDSAAFIYTGDNVTRVNGFGSGDTQEWYHTFQFDDKINPLYQSGLNSEGGDDGYLLDPIVLSKNNVTFWDSHSKGYTESIQYTYNDISFPLTKKVNDEAAKTYEYNCQ